MQINKNLENGILSVSLNGRIDTLSAPQLENELKSSSSGLSEIVFDMKEVSYVSSAGLRVFLAARKQIGDNGKLRLINVSEDVYSVFEITGFVDILTIEKV